MPAWTHLIRFISLEDSQVHLGQLVDTTRDIGQDVKDGKSIAAYVIQGTIYEGRITEEILHVKQVRDQSSPLYVDHTHDILVALSSFPRRV